MRQLVVAALGLLYTATVSVAEPPKAPDIDHICDLIASEADRNDLPRAFFARLIWKESRFDTDAVSPAGAEGIAQFMPGTAKLRGLEDSFDPKEALASSAAYLRALKVEFGNLGLAAAAYNSGENRVMRWLANGGFLPLETEDYVLEIMGEPVDSFADRDHAGMVHPLTNDMPFVEACRQLPVTLTSVVPMAHINVKPWGVQVAGSFHRSAAIRQYQRLKTQIPSLEGHEPVVSRVRTPRGRRGIYAVRIGADSRRQADALCAGLRKAGGACVVLKNR